MSDGGRREKWAYGWNVDLVATEECQNDKSD